MTVAAIEPQLSTIPGGLLEMGVPALPENAALHWRWHSGNRVEVSTFRIGTYSVTNREYRRFMSEEGAPPPKIDSDDFSADNQPAVGISWQDASAYCQWLAERTGRPYRLPRDAEWEHAARGGRTGSVLPWGDDLDQAHACFGGLSAPTAVGSFPPNGYGVYDMIGCVWDWCMELYEDVSDGVPAVNTPTGGDPARNRVLRGGSFLTTDPLNLYIAYRHEDPPDLRHESIGFRVAQSP